jgi:hypothetical protein
MSKVIFDVGGDSDGGKNEQAWVLKSIGSINLAFRITFVFVE